MDSVSKITQIVDSSLNRHEGLATPCLIYDLAIVEKKLQLLKSIQKRHEFQFYYSIKSAGFFKLLEFISKYTRGFSSSSLYESRLLREYFGEQISIHCTSPGFSEKNIRDISKYSNQISFNSWSQYQSLGSLISDNCKLMIRINPATDMELDERYDPCRLHSKLGMSIDELVKQFENSSEQVTKISGIHFHNNCESRNSFELFDTVKKVTEKFGKWMHEFEYINLGGGYLFEDETDLLGFEKTLEYLHENYDLKIIFEPGKAIVDEAGSLVASVTDVFESDGLKVAVLDTTVNHLPEVFEYQRKPVIRNERKEGSYKYRLAGCSCLSGDIFGDYFFDKPLQPGSRIIIENVGAYMYVKASQFNGIALPDVYLSDASGNSTLIKSQSYEDYKNRLG